LLFLTDSAIIHISKIYGYARKGIKNRNETLQAELNRVNLLSISAECLAEKLIVKISFSEDETISNDIDGLVLKNITFDGVSGRFTIAVLAEFAFLLKRIREGVTVSISNEYPADFFISDGTQWYQCAIKTLPSSRMKSPTVEQVAEALQKVYIALFDAPYDLFVQAAQFIVDSQD